MQNNTLAYSDQYSTESDLLLHCRDRELRQAGRMLIMNKSQPIREISCRDAGREIG